MTTNDRFLIEVDDLDVAQKLRHRMMFSLKPRPCVYIIQDTRNANVPYRINVSNEWGMYPSEKLFTECVQIVDEMLSGSIDQRSSPTTG